MMITFINMTVKHNHIREFNFIFDPDYAVFCIVWAAFDVAGTFMLAYFGVIFLARHCLLKNISALHFKILDLMLL
jgi:hypothetical protein